MILDMFSLKGKVAAVTGSNTGMGQAMAVAMAEVGADVALVGRSPMDETAALIAATGQKSHAIKADLLDPGCCARTIDAVVDYFGKIDILINNAGIILRNDALDMTEKEWDDVMNVDLKSLFFLCQAAGRHFVKQGAGGKIINIASLLSFQGGIRVAAYTSAKSGVMGLTRLLGNEWAAKGICVNAIAPGYIETNNTVALRNDAARFKAIVERIPAGRWGVPADVAGAAVFLASPASDYVNGYTLAVDGGWLGR